MLGEEPIVLTENGKYRLYNYLNEKELEKMIVEHSLKIFGDNTYYLNIKKKISSRAGLGTIPDGYVLDTEKKRLYIVEVELIRHDLRKHIRSQIFDIIQALRNEKTRDELAKIFQKELSLKNIEEKELKSIISRHSIIILIDDVGDPAKESNPLMETVDLLSEYAEVRTIPFQTYIKGSNFSQDHIHSFRAFTKEELEKESRKWTFKWTEVPAEEHISRLGDNSKKIFGELREKICSLSPEIKEVHRSNWTTFQVSKLGNFCTIKFPKSMLEIYLKANEDFKDDRGIARDIKRTPSWTFDKVFKIESPSEIDYAVSLIKQAYQCICKTQGKNGTPVKQIRH